ncbi:MAG TPA: methyltransferase domain-containing protein [Usitatibacter sp.]
MNEASKTHLIRGPDFAGKYLTGRVIDIGCGGDLVVPWAEPFDKIDGDAAKVSAVRPAGAYDSVHSSHCLEHMEDPVTTLADWWSLVRPGGFLVTVVPDEELYEQGLWPSLFNPDHKWAFTISQPKEEHVMNVVDLHRGLPGAQIVEAHRHDVKYSHELLGLSRGKLNRGAWARYCDLVNFLQRNGVGRFRPELRMWPYWARQGVPIDQTLGDALAQIQVVVRKAG